MPVLQRGSFSTYYEVQGEGEPVVFVCGLGAELTVWRFQVAELSKHRQVICFDNRGAGRTSAPDEPNSVAQMTEDLAALLEHLKVERASIVGWSMGGVIAQSYALKHPARVARLILMCSFAETDGFVRAAISNWVNMRRSNMSYEHVVRYLARIVYSPALANNAKAYEAFIQAMVASPYRQTDHGFFRQADALIAYRRPANLGDIKTPVIVLAGEWDQLTPKYLSEELAAAIPGAKLKVMPGGHSGMAECPAQYNRQLEELLK
jgi:pimeloyl-ACP methyl ester carboxylesterase